MGGAASPHTGGTAPAVQGSRLSCQHQQAARQFAGSPVCGGQVAPPSPHYYAACHSTAPPQLHHLGGPQMAPLHHSGSAHAGVPLHHPNGFHQVAPLQQQQHVPNGYHQVALPMPPHHSPPNGYHQMAPPLHNGFHQAAPPPMPPHQSCCGSVNAHPGAPPVYTASCSGHVAAPPAAAYSGAAGGHQGAAASSQLLRRLMTSDDSAVFRAHPLFPLLRDLIIADLNFHAPSFPFALIANLPPDFDRLLHNYLSRNPPAAAAHHSATCRPGPVPGGGGGVGGVIDDALRFAHRTLIEKISSRKTELGYQDVPKPLSAIEEFCERFDQAVKNNSGDQGLCDAAKIPGGVYVHESSSPRRPAAPHSPLPRGQPAGDCASPLKLRPVKTEAGGLSCSRAGGVGAGGGGGGGGSDTSVKNKVLPKEAVAAMLAWLRQHQDNPYPNDDEKDALIAQTHLTINQINYWFTNARRRILPKWTLQRYMDQQHPAAAAGQQVAPPGGHPEQRVVYGGGGGGATVAHM